MNTHTWKNIVINPYIALLILLGIYPYGLSFIEQEYVFYLGVVIISIVSCVLLRLQGFGEILRFRSFSWKTIVKLLLGFFALIAWAMVIHELFPLPANQQAINEQQYVGMELFIFNAYAMIVGPIGEELVFRGLLMKNLEKISIFSLEALVSASLFSMGHTLL
ncbi:CPBP family intramembrane metalloprotease [Streptococcus suis]|nr:CPBP family intramembrane metalloprotease [Streptococcus suis]